MDGESPKEAYFKVESERQNIFAFVGYGLKTS